MHNEVPRLIVDSQDGRGHKRLRLAKNCPVGLLESNVRNAVNDPEKFPEVRVRIGDCAFDEGSLFLYKKMATFAELNSKNPKNTIFRKSKITFFLDVRLFLRSSFSAP